MNLDLAELQTLLPSSNDFNDIAALLLFSLLGIIVGAFAERLLRTRAEAYRLSQKTPLALGLLVVARSSIWLGVAIGFRIGTLFLVPEPGMAATAFVVSEVLIVLVLTHLGWQTARLPISVLAPNAKPEDALPKLLVSGLRTLVVLIAITALLHVLIGKVVSVILLAVSFFGLAITLAWKDFLSDLAGTCQLAIGQAFRIGDRITCGAVDGKIEAFQLVNTRVRLASGELATIPNAWLARQTIINHQRVPHIRHNFTYPLPATLDSAQTTELITQVRELLSEAETGIDEPKPTVNLSDNSAAMTLNVTLYRQPNETARLAVEALHLQLHHTIKRRVD